MVRTGPCCVRARAHCYYGPVAMPSRAQRRQAYRVQSALLHSQFFEQQLACFVSANLQQRRTMNGANTTKHNVAKKEATTVVLGTHKGCTFKDI